MSVTSSGNPPARSKASKRAERDADPQKAAARSGIPGEPDLNEPLPKRVLTNKMFWLGIILVLVYATCLVLLYRQVVPDREVPGGRLLGLGSEAVPVAAKYAAISAIPLSLIFMWADRFRPQRIWIWLLTFGWGACVATFLSAQINSWAAGHLSIIGDGDPASGARAAIYVAPWVEEATKGTILFWLAILMRYQWVSRLSGIVLAGLSGTAFAFVENILYYGRAYRYAAQTFGEVEPEQALISLFQMRGLMTFFGHPLFTAMLGIGLAIGVRSKSKVVRVVAPLAGFTAAAFLHMAFNTTATLVSGRALLFMYIGVAIPMVIALIVFIVRQLFREGRLLRDRLTDYVRLGWLPEGDPRDFSRLRTRLRAVWHSVFEGPSSFLDTIRMQRAMTELGYLRDSITRGLVDQAGLAREKVLLAKARDLRSSAVVHPEGRANYPQFRKPAFLDRNDSQGVGWAPPNYPGPAGIGGNYPDPGAPPAGSAPLGQAATQYSEVDPNWKPPGQ